MSTVRWPQEDGALVALARSGDDAAFTELVRRHADRSYRVALRVLRDPHAADDAAQESMVRAWRSLDGFRADAEFTTWLYRIVVNTCLGQIRAGRVAPEQEQVEVTDAAPGPEDQAIAAETGRRVDRALAGLAPGDRAAFVLRTFEGLEYQQIAASLGISVAAVRSRIRRARRSVADTLQEGP